jgi:protein-tyrosine phosphatase
VDLSEITTRLYVASAFYPPQPQDAFDFAGSTILDLAHIIPRKFARPEGAHLVSAYFPDGIVVPPVMVDALSATGKALLDDGHKVVALCDAGRNRSALVAGAILLRMGWTADDAIDRIRVARSDSLSRTGGALTNEHFVAWLKAQP